MGEGARMLGQIPHPAGCDGRGGKCHDTTSNTCAGAFTRVGSTWDRFHTLSSLLQKIISTAEDKINGMRETSVQTSLKTTEPLFLNV